MFYATPTSTLRFGDVVRGYPAVLSQIPTPDPLQALTIGIQHPEFSVILTPCCSIGKGNIAVAPLERIRNTFYSNPYFATDLTVLNRKMEPEKSLPPDAWSRLDPKERQRRLAIGKSFAFQDLFIYAENPVFPAYTVNIKSVPDKTTNFYMVDFKKITPLQCDSVKAPSNFPAHTKVLELSIDTREDLRQKISEYFARIPDEDKTVIRAYR